MTDKNPMYGQILAKKISYNEKVIAHNRLLLKFKLTKSQTVREAFARRIMKGKQVLEKLKEEISTLEMSPVG